MTRGLSILVVEDEPLTLDEIVHQLQSIPDVAEVVPARDSLTALRLLRTRPCEAVFLDISIPGLNGMELASVLSRLANPPDIVFVTASESHAVEAFTVGAVDYVLKPVSPERLRRAVSRIRRTWAHRKPTTSEDDLTAIKVRSAGRIRYVRREQVRYVEARGDYVKLHTSAGDFLVRMPLTALEKSWTRAGFVRVHRSFLVALSAVVDLRTNAVGHLVAHTESGDVPVSRRHARELKERLRAAAWYGEIRGTG